MATFSLGGMPTDVDVERLHKEIGVPEVGSVVSYERLEEVLHISRKKNRFLTVVYAWSRSLDRAHNIVLKAVANEGYKALDNVGRVEESARRYKAGLRRIHKAGSIAVRTGDTGLDEEHRRARDHIGRVAAQHALVAATEARQLRYPDPQVKSPKAARA